MWWTAFLLLFGGIALGGAYSMYKQKFSKVTVGLFLLFGILCFIAYGLWVVPTWLKG